MKKIYNILQYNKEQYEMLKFSFYMNWADEHSRDTTHLQEILNNQIIYNWFCREYNLKEKNFLLDYVQINIDNKNANIEDIRNLYDSYTCHITAYPKILLSKKDPNRIIKIPLQNKATINN